MAFRAIFDANSPVKLVLACDPDVEAANTAEALRAYIREGALEALNIPESAAWISIRAMTHEDEEGARVAAGRVPRLGGRIYERLAESKPLKEAKKAQNLALIEALRLEADGDDDGAKIARERAEMRRAEAADIEAQFWDQLSDDEAEAARRWLSWLEAKTWAIVTRCTVDFDSDPAFKADPEGFLRRLDPPEMMAAVISELMVHIRRISELGELGKARYARPSGCAPTTA
ncbi:hypothetical protein KKB55_11040 [Myxococcota bacterium]|nr:hypothetical protein [Myxococcota bacterium]MBU1898272.1 hypothetical protein [Myxococcota bacterium]